MRPRRDDIATGHGALQPIKLVGADNDDGIFPVQRDPLRAALLRLPHDFTEARFCVLKPPSPGARAAGKGLDKNDASQPRSRSCPRVVNS